MQYKTFFISILLLLSHFAVGQTLSIEQPLQEIHNSSVLALYNKQFRQWMMPEIDNPFPFAVIRIDLSGDEASIRAAKSKLGLFLGYMYCVESVIRTEPNQIILLVPQEVRNIYLTCGDGCEKQLLASGIRLHSNSIYTCKVHYKQEETIYKQKEIVNEPKRIQITDQHPFDQYAKEFVEPRINEWQKKGEFEKTSDWQARVNETTRKQKIDSLVHIAKKNYLADYKSKNPLTFTLTTYDADNEVYLVKSSRGEDLLVAIPIADAPYVKQNWASHTASPKYDIQGTEVVMTSVEFTFPNKKTYSYKSSQNLTYAQANIQYNFNPLEINFSSNTSAQQPKGQQTIQHKQLTIGKSEVDTNVPKNNNVNDKTFVVILANEDYESVASVPFAKNDGNTFKKYCINTLGIPEKNIRLRENATLNNMRSELGWLKQVCEAYKGEASVIFYYAGHGIPDENDKSAYLLPTDGDGHYVHSGYKLDDLYNRLGTMQAKTVTIFMDACFSGSKREDGMLASARGVAIKSKAGVPQGNMVVFSAAQGDETAYPNKEEGHGMFTYYLLKKLQETKGDVTLKDLGDYITTNVRQQSIVLNSKSQTPCVTPSGNVADSWQTWKLK